MSKGFRFDLSFLLDGVHIEPKAKAFMSTGHLSEISMKDSDTRLTMSLHLLQVLEVQGRFDLLRGISKGLSTYVSSSMVGKNPPFGNSKKFPMPDFLDASQMQSRHTPSQPWRSRNHRYDP